MKIITAQSQIPLLQKESEQIQSEINNLKGYLQAINRKDLQELGKKITTIKQEEQVIDKDIQTLQAKQKQIHDLEKQQISLTTQLATIRNRKENIQNELAIAK